MQTCHSCPSTGICKESPSQTSQGKSIDRSASLTVALAGNANVGKSAVFNQLTGVDQIIGNWPGKTVERAEGMLQYKGQKIRVIDLPGIYSFSTFSMEELVSRESSQLWPLRERASLI